MQHASLKFPMKLLAGLLLLGSAALANASETSRPPELDIPLKCTLGQDCYVQHYVDTQGGQGAKDYSCGSLTYNDHTGTDIRIRTLKDMETGVPVIAAADGVVGNLRRGVKDQYFSDYDAQKRKEIYNIGLGNVVILNHNKGWSTFYAHLKKGSITVEKGQRVKKGEVLGYIGMSGLTDFPHLHFEVRYRNRQIDPFTGLERDRGCDNKKFTLWSDIALRQLSYKPTFFVNTGFSETRPTNRQDVESGEKKEKVLNPAAPTLFFWSYYIGVRQGDEVRLSLTGPDGRKLKEYRLPRDSKNRITKYPYLGVKRPPAGWRSGTYRGEITITRDGQTYRDEAFINVE
ncbi:MAG: M23 family metallopeptidase [Sneathiella sp.]|nr:M23 family metallopeptidase [Sneathiella sp.]